MAIGAVAAAIDSGITLFDAAPLYGHGLAEHRCGTALRGHPRDGFVLSTKVGRWMDPSKAPAERSRYAGGLPHAAVIDYSYDGTMRSFEQSLLRLGLDRIDILLIHDVDVWTHGAAAIERRFGEAMDGAYRALDQLRARRRFRPSASASTKPRCASASLQPAISTSCCWRDAIRCWSSRRCRVSCPPPQRKGLGVMLGGVFNSGILATGAAPGAHYNYAVAPPAIMARVERIEAVCRAHGTRLADAALQFPLAHPAVSSIVLGATSDQEVRRNIASLSRKIPSGLWSDLKAEGLLEAHVPVPA